MARSRRTPKWMMASFLILALGLTGGTVVVASSFKTTEQKAAEASPPEPSIITASVRSGQIMDTVPLVCFPAFKDYMEILDPVAQPRVVTGSYVSEGQEVTNATLIAEINGDPIFTMIGAFPLYRDLAIGDYGPDARMLNQALIDAGLMYAQNEPAMSLITAITFQAVSYLYQENGYVFPVAKTQTNEASDEEEINVQVISQSSFKIIPESGTVIGKPIAAGKLENSPLLTIGIGAQGLTCETQSGAFPPEAVSGQEILFPSLGTQIFTTSIVSNTNPVKAVPVDPADPQSSANTGSSPRDNGDQLSSNKVFVEVGEAAKEFKDQVRATLVIDKSESEGLIVPSAALWTKDGSTMVTVVSGEQKTDVGVTVEFTSGGENVVRVNDANERIAPGMQLLVSGP